jgi:hypothetical protein
MSRSAYSHDLPALKREIERLSSLDLDSLRVAWRAMFNRPGKGITPERVGTRCGRWLGFRLKPNYLMASG